MKFLIANYEFQNFFGGTQTWSLTMLQALRKLGHTAFLDAYVSHWDEEFVKHKAPPQFKPDVIIVNGNETLKKFRFENALLCQICHGILPILEQPKKGADMYFAVSEEVEQHIKSLGFKCSGILRNPIALPHPSSLAPIADELGTIAIISRRRMHVLSEELTRYFEVLNVGNPPSRNVWIDASSADLVIGTGRVAYEAMAHGKAVIISGTNSGRGVSEWMDGYVTEELFYNARKNNCSGRHYKKSTSKISELLNETEKYTKQSGMDNYSLIARENDAQVVASIFVETISSYTSRPSSIYGKAKLFLRRT